MIRYTEPVGMDNNENDPLHAAWHEAWSRLGPESSEEERLAVYHAVRDAGSVPEDAAFRRHAPASNGS